MVMHHIEPSERVSRRFNGMAENDLFELLTLRNFRSNIHTTIKGQMAFDFELVQVHLLSCTVKSIILGHNIVRFVHYCVILQYNKRVGKVEYLRIQVLHIVRAT